MFNWIINKIMGKSNRISRTEAVKMITATKGKFFSVTFVKSTDGSLRTLNGNVKSNPFTPLGNITMYSAKDKGYRSFNPKAIVGLSINGSDYKVK